MRVRLTCIADTHAGSTVGLAPPGPIPHPEGLEISPTPASRWLWSIYQRHLEQEAEAAKDHDVRALVFVGDLMDGLMHHGQVQLYHPEPSVERWITQRVAEAAVEVIDPTHIFVILGTPSHVGQMGASEERIGSWLVDRYGDKLQRPDEHRYGWGRLRAEFGGVRFDVTHHGKMGRLPHTRESYHKRYAFDVWSSHAMYRGVDWVPDVAIRGHLHKYADSGPVAPHRRGTRAFALPCYQMGTDWVRRMAVEEAADIGMLGLTATGGRLADVHPQVVYPKVEEPVWTV